MASREVFQLFFYGVVGIIVLKLSESLIGVLAVVKGYLVHTLHMCF